VSTEEATGVCNCGAQSRTVSIDRDGGGIKSSCCHLSLREQDGGERGKMDLTRERSIEAIAHCRPEGAIRTTRGEGRVTRQRRGGRVNSIRERQDNGRRKCYPRAQFLDDFRRLRSDIRLVLCLEGKLLSSRGATIATLLTGASLKDKCHFF
jgi:hypothetical protein